jgi:hypothetical protein
VFPIAIAAGVLLLVVCGVFGFFALQKHNQPVAQIAAESPSPLGGPATTTPSPTPESSVTSATPETKVEATPKKNPREEAKKTPQRREQPLPAEGEGHEGDVRVTPPDVPETPDFDEPKRQRRPGVRVLPGGVMIRNLPDGSQIITTSDGTRVMVTKDGKRQILSPARPNRRRNVPAPAPEPSP